MFDLDASGFLDEVELEVPHPVTGKPSGLKITFFGPGSPEAIASDEANYRKMLDEEEKWQQEAIESVKAGKDAPKKNSGKSLEKSRLQNARIIAARIKTSTELKYNGQVVRLNPTLAEEILSSPKFSWLLLWADKTLGKRENFLMNSPEI